jgi:hypothetical protein
LCQLSSRPADSLFASRLSRERRLADLPRNLRSHRLYGFSPVEQIALTINIALRREQATLDYYNTGSIPDSFATLPKDWTVDQIRQFQDYFDALMSGNLARRRGPSSCRGVQAHRDAPAAAEGSV